VVPIEETQRTELGIKIPKPTTPSRNVAARGSDIHAGQRVLRKGMMLEAAQLAVAASIGALNVNIFARPQVAVLATGDELVSMLEVPGPTQIRNSNTPMLVALLEKMGCTVVLSETVPDQVDTLRDAIARGLSHDALFISGGMSMGSRDYVPQLLKELGVDLRITKLRIKPGKPFAFGVKNRTEPSGANPSFVFGLPGNPVSGFVCTVRFASRLITRLGGGQIQERWHSGKLDNGLLVNGPREFYQPALWVPAGGGRSAQNEFANVTPLAWKGSADIYTLAAANALIVRAENEPPVPKGTLVRVLEI
jgi:molybdopterin molybdotransferase